MRKLKYIAALAIALNLTACSKPTPTSKDFYDFIECISSLTDCEAVNPNSKHIDIIKENISSIIDLLVNMSFIFAPDSSDDLLGPDANANGIRDDIEAWIDKKYLPDEQRDAAYKLARAYQKTLAIDLEDKHAAIEQGNILYSALVCAHNKFEGLNIGYSIPSKIESKTFNTRARNSHYLKLEDHFDTTTWEILHNNACQKMEVN